LRMLFSLWCLFCLSAPSALAETPSNEAKLAVLATSQIQCASLAGYTNSAQFKVEGSDLALAGISNMRMFLTAYEEGRITPDELRRVVPWTVAIELKEPGISKEFLLGRLYQIVMHAARERVTTYKTLSRYGERREIEDWPVEAEHIWRSENCSLLIP
jgi:hypothetical protein